jgi:hypothetical protein
MAEPVDWEAAEMSPIFVVQGEWAVSERTAPGISEALEMAVSTEHDKMEQEITMITWENGLT